MFISHLSLSPLLPSPSIFTTSLPIFLSFLFLFPILPHNPSSLFNLPSFSQPRILPFTFFLFHFLYMTLFPLPLHASPSALFPLFFYLLVSSPFHSCSILLFLAIPFSFTPILLLLSLFCLYCSSYFIQLALPFSLSSLFFRFPLLTFSCAAFL